MWRRRHAIMERSKNLVSIITPTYNRAYILGNTIDSVLVQTDNDWELIIVDDGSTDNTEELIRSYKDARIKYFSQENRGPSAARNRAFDILTGGWVSYIDSDNELLPNYLEVMKGWLADNPDALYALPKGNRTLELYEDGRLVRLIDDSADFPDALTARDIALRNIHFDINGFMHSRKIIDAGIRFDEDMDSLEDWDFALTICERYPDRFLYVPVRLFNYHQRYGTDGLVSNASYAKWAQSFERVYQKHKDDKILQGQTWYPDRVEKYRKLEQDYQEGKAPPNHLRYFTRK